MLLRSVRRLLATSFALSVLATVPPVFGGGLSLVEVQPNVPGTRSVIVSPDGAHVYAIAPDLVTRGIAIFSRDASTGALTRLPTLGVPPLSSPGIREPRALAISPDGGQVYLANRRSPSFGADGISVFTRNPSTGALTFLQLIQDGEGASSGLFRPAAVVVSSDGLHVYVRGEAGDLEAIALFSRHPTTGALTFVETVTFDGQESVGDRGIALSPDGVHLYAIGDDAILTYGRNAGTGSLTLLSVAEQGVGGVSGIVEPRNLALSADGANVYVAAAGNFGPGNHDVTEFARNPGTGALTFQAKHHESRPLRGPITVAVAPSGRHVLVGSSFIGDNAVALYSRNTTTGALTVVDSEANNPALDSPMSIVISPEGNHAYVAAGGGDSVAVFDIRCGNAVLDPGEGCDDGNNLNGDGCGDGCWVAQCYACSGEPSVCAPDDGTACDDGNICSTADTCAGGLCLGVPDDGVACNDDNVCTIDDMCTGGSCYGSLTPQAGCRSSTVPGGSSLRMRTKPSDLSSDLLSWKWTKGQATTVADFGDPTMFTGYTACVYDQSPRQLVLQLDSGYCGLASCWKPTAKGFKYRRRISGVDRITLKAGGEGKAKIEFGALNLLLAARETLPLVTPVTFQLKAWHYDALNNGPAVDQCWQGVYSAPVANDALGFKASSD